MTNRAILEGAREMKAQFHSDENEAKILVYRAYFLRLLALAKPLRDQLLIELPVLEALRAGEVASLRVEYIDFDHGDLQVQDSKKHKLFTVPLDTTVAEHLAEYVSQEHLSEGFVFLPITRRGRPKRSAAGAAAFDESYLGWVWRKWCKTSGVPNMSPRYGRAYFACKWHYVDRKSIYGLMAVLRHTNILSTQSYLAKIIAYDDVKNEFYRGAKSPFASACERADKCPLSAEGCYCGMFTPNLKVKTFRVQAYQAPSLQDPQKA